MNLRRAIQEDEEMQQKAASPTAGMPIYRGEVRTIPIDMIERRANAGMGPAYGAGSRRSKGMRRYNVGDWVVSEDPRTRAKGFIRQVTATSSDTRGPSIGVHWSASPQTPEVFASDRSETNLTEQPGYSKRQQDTEYGRHMQANVIWEGVLDDPESQINWDDRSEYGPMHWEREINLRPGSQVKVTGARVHIPERGIWHPIQFAEAKLMNIAERRY